MISGKVCPNCGNTATVPFDIPEGRWTCLLCHKGFGETITEEQRLAAIAERNREEELQRLIKQQRQEMLDDQFGRYGGHRQLKMINGHKSYGVSIEKLNEMGYYWESKVIQLW